VSRDHLEVLRGPHGIWQHASLAVPDEAHGSCTDDVARALMVDLLHRRELGWVAVRDSARSSLAFLCDAQDPTTGTFRNFRSADGTWLDSGGSQDSQGRAVLALGTMIAESPETVSVALAARLLVTALPTVRRLTALRATASALLGCDAALDFGIRGEVATAFGTLAARLRRVFGRVDLDSDWPWPEPVLTYENALLPRALIVAGERLGDDELVQTGLRVLDWLIGVQTSRDGAFSPIGCHGWWARGGTRNVFDQQPIEATATILAAEAALDLTGNARYRRAAEAAYAWFLGDNVLGVQMALPATGGCRDGLMQDGVNGNQGAESTLMWLMALEHLRGIRAAAVRQVTRRGTGSGRLITGTWS
jgi:hypothetical protein